MKITNYEENAVKIAENCVFGFDRAKSLFAPDSAEYARVCSFFRYSGSACKLNIFTNWHRPLDLAELNAVIVNIGSVSFSPRTRFEQEATTLYDIIFCAKGENGGEVSRTLLLAARIMRESLTAASLEYFRAARAFVGDLSFDISRIQQSVHNTCGAVLTFNITTRETLTDVWSSGGAHSNDTSIFPASKRLADAAKFNIFKEW